MVAAGELNLEWGGIEQENTIFYYNFWYLTFVKVFDFLNMYYISLLKILHIFQ